MSTSEWKECHTILTEFFAIPETGPFHEPVEWKEYGLFDYPKIVAIPMDMGTIQGNMDKKKYVHPANFVADMRLVWSNCKLYNADDSEFHALARRLSDQFETRIRDTLAPETLSTQDDALRSSSIKTSGPSLSQKTTLSQNLYKISSEHLGQVVHVVEQECPVALEKLNADELEIDLDGLDTATFALVEALVLECLPTAKGGHVLSKSARKAKKRGAPEDDVDTPEHKHAKIN